MGDVGACGVLAGTRPSSVRGWATVPCVVRSSLPLFDACDRLERGLTEAPEGVIPPLPTEGEGIRTLVVRGIRWKLASQVISQLLRIAAGLLIARSLTPREYGL